MDETRPEAAAAARVDLDEVYRKLQVETAAAAVLRERHGC